MEEWAVSAGCALTSARAWGVYGGAATAPPAAAGGERPQLVRQAGAIRFPVSAIPVVQVGPSSLANVPISAPSGEQDIAIHRFLG